jgi:hypothetical protein
MNRILIGANNGARVIRRDVARPGQMRVTPWSNIRGKTVRDRAFGQRRMMRDVMPGITTTNQLPPANSLTAFGWMGQALGDMGNGSAWADSLNSDNEIVIPTGFPLESMATSPAALLNACLIACAGNGTKNYGTQAIIAGAVGQGGPGAAGVVGNQGIALQTQACTVFGMRVRISNALTTFKFGSYEFILGTTAPANAVAYPAASVLSYIIVQVASLPVDVVMLAITNTAGKGTVVGTSTPYCVIPFTPAGTALAAAGAYGSGYINQGSFAVTDAVYAETLNMRDIGNIEAAVGSGALSI